MTPTLDHRRPARRRGWTWRWWHRYAVGAAALLLVGVLLPGRTVEIRVDAVTGSTATRTRWPLGLTTGPRVKATMLETRLRSAGIAWTPAWQLLGESDYDLLGRRRRVGCGLAPPVYDLAPFRDARYFAGVTDDELRDLVRALQLGTERQQSAAVKAMEKKLAASLEASWDADDPCD